MEEGKNKGRERKKMKGEGRKEKIEKIEEEG